MQIEPAVQFEYVELMEMLCDIADRIRLAERFFGAERRGLALG
ncbi:MAG: hypothetical protein AAGD04_02745 [Pseudomonadota bacterium]